LVLGAVLLASAVSVGGVVLAQDQPTPPVAEPPDTAQPDPGADPAAPDPAAPAALPPAPQAPEGVGSPDGSKVVEISPEEMTARANTYVQNIQKILLDIVKLKNVLEQQQDVDTIKLGCVNEKWLQAKALLKAAEDARTRMLEAIASEKEDARYDQFSILTIANEQATEVANLADQCVGQDNVYLGPTAVDVEGGNEPDDPTKPGEPGYPDIEDLPTGSPFV
jgi:hypothetical protein